MLMAGMLPGVECARRRRCRLGSSMDLPGGSRRSSICSYTTCHEVHLSANPMQRSIMNKGLYGGSLGGIAREARERLDERLKTHRSSEMKRHNSTGMIRNTKNGGAVGGSSSTLLAHVQREVFCSKKSSRRFSWTKMGWKASEQDECVVCLEDFKTGDILMHLPCAHRFHSSCVVPWLESSPHCPCCRMSIFS